MQIFVNPNYDFVKWRFHAVAFSAFIILLGLGMYLTRGLRMGIDFSGGANVVLKFREQVPFDALRSQIANASVQRYGKAEENAVLIRLPKQGSEGDYAGQLVQRLNVSLNPESATKHDLNYQGRDTLAEILKNADPDRKGTGPAAHDYYYTMAQSVISRRSELGLFSNMSQVTSAPGVSSSAGKVISEKAFLGKFNVLNQESVGPQVGKELQQKAIWAVILSTIAMGIYITFRFDLGFGIAAMICIVHDVLIALAFLVLIRGEFSLNIVAALLLIVGYSVNDTVVTYDRVRENARKLKARVPFGEQLNNAMNQTLSRTILTSGSVILVLISLVVFGGKVIHEFSLVLLVGVLSGTYSTLMIVPAVAVAWEEYVSKRRGGKAPRRAEANRSEPLPRKPAPERAKRA